MHLFRETRISCTQAFKQSGVARALIVSIAAALTACSGGSGATPGLTAVGTGSSSTASLEVAPISSTTTNPIKPPPSGAYFGAWVKPASAQQSIEQAIEGLEGTFSNSRTTLALHMHYKGWQVTFPDPLGGPGDPSIAQDIQHGRAPVVSWGCSNTNGGDELAAIASGNDDGILKSETDALKKFSGRIFLRWFWEFNISLSPDSNGNWPNGNSCFENVPASKQASEFTSAWRYIHDYFSKNGVTNVTWLWNPNIPTNGVDISPFYPATSGTQSYVDWIGVDGYDKEQNGPTFSDVMNVGGFYSTVSGSLYGGKPLMVSETGACDMEPQPHGQAYYIGGAASAMKSNQFPLIKAFLYFDADGNYCSNQNWGDGYWLKSNTPGLTAYDNMGELPYFLPMVSQP